MVRAVCVDDVVFACGVEAGSGGVECDARDPLGAG